MGGRWGEVVNRVMSSGSLVNEAVQQLKMLMQDMQPPYHTVMQLVRTL